MILFQAFLCLASIFLLSYGLESGLQQRDTLQQPIFYYNFTPSEFELILEKHRKLKQRSPTDLAHEFTSILGENQDLTKRAHVMTELDQRCITLHSSSHRVQSGWCYFGARDYPAPRGAMNFFCRDYDNMAARDRAHRFGCPQGTHCMEKIFTNYWGIEKHYPYCEPGHVPKSHTLQLDTPIDGATDNAYSNQIYMRDINEAGESNWDYFKAIAYPHHDNFNYYLGDRLIQTLALATSFACFHCHQWNARLFVAHPNSKSSITWYVGTT